MKKFKLLLLFLFVLLSSTQSLLFLGRDASSHASAHQTAQTPSNLSTPQFPNIIKESSASAPVGGSVVATVPVGIGPWGVAFDNGNGYVYVTNSGSNTTSVFSGTTLVTTVPVGKQPFGVAYDSGNGYVYVANHRSESMSVINGTTVVATVPVGIEPYGVAYDNGNGYVYVTNDVVSTISVINGTTVLATIPSGNGGVAYDARNGYIYAANDGSNTLSVINRTTVIATIVPSNGFGDKPVGVGYDSGNGDIYVTNFNSGTVSLINGTTVVANVRVGSQPVSVAYDSGNGYVYVTNSASNNVSVINGTTVVATIPVGVAPIGVGYDIGNGDIYVTNYGSGTVSVISSITPFNCEWDASSGRFPDQACPPWQLVNTSSTHAPVISAGSMVFNTTTAGERMYYQQSGPDISFPSNAVIEARMKFDSGTSIDAARLPANVGFNTAPNVGNRLFIGLDKVFLLTGDLIVGQTATVDTHLVFHTYTISVNGTGGIRVFQDGVAILTGSTFSSPNIGNAAFILFGQASTAAFGVSEWQFVHHNSHATGCASQCTPAPSGLIHWWRAEGNANDTVGGNSGALVNGAGFGSGEVGRAFSFNGTNQYVQTANRVPFGSNDFTVDLWANFNSSPSVMIFISDDNGSGCTEKWWFGLGGGPVPGGTINFHINTGTCAGLGYFAQHAFSPNLHQWYNFAVTRNAGNITIYVDGVKVSSELTASTSNPTVPLTIGTAEGGAFFNGLIDEVQIYNLALSPSIIQAIHDAGSAGVCPCVPAPSGLVSWWPLDGNANDIRGGNSGMVVGTGGQFVPAEVGQGFQSGGQGSLVQVNNSSSLSVKQFTIDAWLRVNAINTGTANMPIVWKGNNLGSDLSTPFGIGVIGNPGSVAPPSSGIVYGTPAPGKLFAIVTNGTFEQDLYSSSPLPVGSFVHVAFAVNGSNIILYVNGQVDNAANQLLKPSTSTFPLQIGSLVNTPTNSYFNGIIDEVQLFNRGLALSEVQAIYNAGSLGQCKPVPVPLGGRLFVANFGSNTISVIDGSTNIVVATVKVGNGPYYDVFDPFNNDVYVTNTGTNTVSVIDATSDAVVATISIGGSPRGVAFDPSNGYVYVAVTGSTVSVIDSKSNTVVTTISVGNNPYGVAFDPSNGDVYVANTGSDTVSVIDSRSNTVVASVDVGAGTSPHGVAVDSSNNDIYVTNYITSTVSVINGNTNTVVATLNVGSRPAAVAFDSSNDRVYVANQLSNTVSVIDPSSNTVVATVDVRNGPLGVAFDPANGDIYVGDSGSNTVSVISGSTNAVVATVTVGTSPIGIAVEVPTATWIQLFPTSSPPPRYFTSMASDAADGYVVLFGGENTTHVLGDTWIFKAGVWTQLSPSTSPPPRYGASMVYDAADHYVILFGGAANGNFLSDTWEFKGGVWTQLSPASAPSPRYFVSTTYDVADSYVVLFGGENSGVFLSDTWKFKAGTWTQLPTSTSPSARCCVSMTYDAADSYVLLFGGDTSTVFGDTWIFKAGVWTQLSPTSSPSIRAAAGMAYDSAQGYVLLFGGESVTSATAPLRDTWAFTSGIWTQLSPTSSPSPRDAFELVYDSTDGYPLLFSGYNGTGVLGDTWKFGPITTVSTKATPTISSIVAPSSFTIGGSASDLATVSGGSSPTGTVTYTAYSDSACATPVFTSTSIPLGTHSAVFTPSTAGTYLWVAKYNGDANNNAVSTICGASGETLTVVPAPDFTLTPSSMTITVAANSIGSDKLRVDATNGFTGTVSFLRVGSLSGLSYSCSSVTLSPTIVSANSTCTFGSNTPGMYTAIVNGTGGSPLVFHLVTYTVVVAKNTPSIHTALSTATITVGESVTDSATLTGTDLLTASGTVTYQFFSGSSCAGTATIVGVPVVVNSGVIPTSVSQLFNSAGPYSWNAVYSGDASNDGATSTCESLIIEKATPRVTSTVTPLAITVGGSATDLAAVSGFIPTGTITYTAYSDSSCSTSVFTSASIPLGTSSGAFTPTATGTYYWVASYSGDSNNNAVATTCGAVGETLTVNGIPFDYSLSVSPVSASIIAGASTSTTVTATLARGTAQPVTLLLLISPNPAVCQVTSGPSSCGTISFSPTSITPSSHGATSTLTISTTSIVSPGTYILTITGSPSGSSHSSATFTLTISAPSVSTVGCGHDLSCSVQSNATLTHVKFAGITIHAQADGPKGTHGYANITVPKTAIPNIDNLHVFVDNNKLARSDVTISSNSTDYFIYFTFTFHSPVQIDIQLTAPENAPPLILGLDPTIFYEIVGALAAVLVVIVAVAVISTRRRSRASKIPRQR